MGNETMSSEISEKGRLLSSSIGKLVYYSLSFQHHLRVTPSKSTSPALTCLLMSRPGFVTASWTLPNSCEANQIRHHQSATNHSSFSHQKQNKKLLRLCSLSHYSDQKFMTLSLCSLLPDHCLVTDTITSSLSFHLNLFMSFHPHRHLSPNPHNYDTGPRCSLPPIRPAPPR